MTGKSLYDKHVQALKNTERKIYRNREWVRVWPSATPEAWEFVDNDRQRYYNELAKLVTPKRGAA